jgi:copper chaperone
MSPLSSHPHAASTDSQLTYLVAGMTCEHCTLAVTQEVTKVAGVAAVHVDLGTKVVRVDGDGVEPAAVVAAMNEAGYEAVAA